MTRPLDETWSAKYFRFLIQHPKGINTFVVLLTAVCVYYATHLELRTNFSELLPEKLPSVQSFKKAVERMGGTGLLLIGIESPDFEANKKFDEALVAKLKPMVGQSLRYFEYRYEDVENFISKYGLQYLTLDQLKRTEQELHDEIDRHKEDSLGLGLDDGDPSASSNKKSSSNWMQEMDPRLRIFLQYRDAYLSAEDGKILVISVRPMGSSLGVEQSMKLVRQIQGYVDDLKPKSFHPQMQVSLGGNVQSAIAEYDTIRHDIVDTALLLVALILMVLFIFFWSLRNIALLVLNLIFPVAWTFGLTYWHIGYLNTQTAFLGSLVVGTGINYGIMFIARYLENRRAGGGIEDSIIRSIQATAIPTLIASSTTTVSFLSLLAADNKGFSQFGFIGSCGIVLCWIAAFTILPLWLYLLELRFPVNSFRNPLADLLKPSTIKLGNYIVRRAPVACVVLTAASVMGVVGFLILASNPIEYNFDHLRNKIARTEGTEAVELRLHKVFSASLTPSIVLMDNLRQAEELCPRVMDIANAIPATDRIIASCMSLYELLPKSLPNVAERHEQMIKVQHLLQDPALRFAKDYNRVKEFRDHLTFEIPSVKDIPPQLSRRFAEKNGQVGLIGFVNPDSTKPLNDGLNLLSYTNSLSKIDLPSGGILTATGDSFILADLLRGIKHDGPLVALIAFIGSSCIAMFLSGGVVSGLIMAFCLAVATWWMLCAQGFFDIKYNFFNFIALPLTFGIGIDYPINVFVRCVQENFRNYGKILATSGAAVLLCSLTTIIGYYTLIGASNLALVSFAKLAIIGEFTCLITALILLPVILSLSRKFHGDQAAFGETGNENDVE